MEPQTQKGSPKPQDPGGTASMPPGAVSGKVTRENTKTEVQSLGMGRKTATLYLSRTHTNLRQGRNSSVASRLPAMDTTLTSRQPSQLAEEDELIAAVGLKDIQREFTFTGYDIMADNGEGIVKVHIAMTG